MLTHSVKRDHINAITLQQLPIDGVSAEEMPTRTVCVSIDGRIPLGTVSQTLH